MKCNLKYKDLVKQICEDKFRTSLDGDLPREYIGGVHQSWSGLQASDQKIAKIRIIHI